MDCVARGTSKRSGLIEPLTCIRVQLRQGRGLPSLEEVTLERSYRGILSDLDRMQWAGYWVHLWQEAFDSSNEDCPAYPLLRLALDALDLGLESLWLTAWVDLQVSSLLGQSPDFGGCVLCGQSMGQGFSCRQGGVVCRGCQPELEWKLSPPVLQWLRFLQKVSLQGLARGRPKLAEVRQVRALMNHWMLWMFPRLERFVPS